MKNYKKIRFSPLIAALVVSFGASSTDCSFRSVSKQIIAPCFITAGSTIFNTSKTKEYKCLGGTLTVCGLMLNFNSAFNKKEELVFPFVSSWYALKAGRSLEGWLKKGDANRESEIIKRKNANDDEGEAQDVSMSQEDITERQGYFDSMPKNLTMAFGAVAVGGLYSFAKFGFRKFFNKDDKNTI